MKNSFAILIFIVVLGIGGGIAYGLHGTAVMESLRNGIGEFIIALALASSVQVADQWKGW